MTAILAAALPSKSNSPAMHEQRRRPTTISPTVQSPIWRQQRGKSPLSKGRAQRPESIVDELTGLLINDNGGSANQKFSKGAHRFPVDSIELSLDSPECNSEASTSSSIESTGSSTQMLLPDSPWKDQIPPKSTSDLDEQTNILLRPNRRLLHSEPRELDALRRWSAMSITSTGTLPPDAVNCDCTSLAWAALRSSTARKRRLLSQKQKQDESYRKISGTNGNFSTDSGLGSSSGSEDSHSQSGNLTPMANKPPMARKRRKRSLSLIGLMRRMFDGDRRKSTSSKASLIAPSPSINDIGGFSPKWRDDVILNEASPLHHRLSMDNAPVQNTAFRDEQQNKLYSSPQINSNAQTTKQVAFNGSATPKQPATVQPLQRNGSPSLTEKPNATIAGANRQPVQNSFSQQPKQQPIAQKTLSSTLVSNKTPISSSTTFGTVPTANLTTSTFNAAPIQQNKQPPALQNRSPHALPHQPVVQHRPAAKPQQPRQPNIAGRLANCPQFHYPSGRPVPRAENDAVREKVRQLFNANTANPQLDYTDMDKLCKTIGLAVYSKRAVYEACMRLSAVTVDPNMTIPPPMTLNQFNTYWQLMTADCHDESSRFIFTLAAAATGERKPRTYLVRDDFTNILVDLIHTYPGLSFLVNSTQFHSKYCEVVIVRIFWNVNRSWTGKITAHELRKSDFLPTLHLLETISDINKITDYFSYEHFYVAYCKFWELDTNHDLIIDREDMRQHCNGAIPDVVIDRVFSGAVMRNIPKLPVKTKGPVKTLQVETIGFEDFVAFLLAEEDKKHPTSIEYWFRILDLNGDGLISLYEMEYFYREIEAKLTQHNFDTLAFRDVACNLFDSIAPSTKGYVTLKELKKCGLAHRFFNTFVNYLKYLEQESSEGERASVKSSGDREMSDWETYCALEYELLLTDNDVEYDENIDLVLDDNEEKNAANKTVE